MKLQFFNHLLEQHPNMEPEKYINELNFIYGAIWEIGDVTEKIKLEICDIESKRLNRKTFDDMEFSPWRFVKEYSEIAFSLATEHYLSGTTYDVAIFMKDVLTNFLNCGFLDETRKKMLRWEISDTILDFKSASGLDKISSMRMIPVLKTIEKENE